MGDEKINLKERSNTIFEVVKNTPYNFVPMGIMKGLGLDEKDINNKPFIGVVNTWNELNPGHKHLNILAEAVKYGIIEAGNADLEVKSIKSQPACFRVVAKGYTNFAFDWFFKVRDHYESIIDSSSMKPKFFIRNVREGNTKFDQFYTFNHNEKIVNTGEKNITVPDNVQDMVS